MITRACIDRVIAGLQNSPVEPTFMAFLEFCRHLPALPPGERIKLIVELRPDGFPADLLPGGCYITRYDMLRLRSDCSGTYPGAVGVAAQEMREAITHWKDLVTKQTTHREAVERQLKTLWYQQRLAAYSRAHRTEVPCSDVDVAVYRACLQQLGPGDTAASLLQLLRITNGAERIVQWYDSLVEVMDSEAARTADVWPTLHAWCGLQSDVGPPGLLLPAVAPALGDLPGTASAPIIADVVGSPLNSRDTAPTVPGTTGVDPGTLKLRAPVSSKGAMSTVPYTVVSCPLSPVSVVLKQVQTSRAAEATPSVAEGVGLSCYDVAVRAYDTGQTGGPPRAVTESTLSPLDPSDISIPCHVSAMVPTAGAVPGEDAGEAANLTDRSKKRPRSLDQIVAPPSSCELCPSLMHPSPHTRAVATAASDRCPLRVPETAVSMGAPSPHASKVCVGVGAAANGLARHVSPIGDRPVPSLVAPSVGISPVPAGGETQAPDVSGLIPMRDTPGTPLAVSTPGTEQPISCSDEIPTSAAPVQWWRAINFPGGSHVPATRISIGVTQPRTSGRRQGPVAATAVRPRAAPPADSNPGLGVNQVQVVPDEVEGHAHNGYNGTASVILTDHPQDAAAIYFGVGNFLYLWPRQYTDAHLVDYAVGITARRVDSSFRFLHVPSYIFSPLTLSTATLVERHLALVAAVRWFKLYSAVQYGVLLCPAGAQQHWGLGVIHMPRAFSHPWSVERADSLRLTVTMTDGMTSRLCRAAPRFGRPESKCRGVA